MSGHLSPQQMERYRLQALPPAERTAVTSHLADCETCRQRLESAERLETVFRAVRDELEQTRVSPSEHLSPEQVAAYVDAEIDPLDRELVEGHLEICPHCVGDVRDLRAFRAHLRSFPPRLYSPLASRSLWRRLRGTWHLKASGLRIAAAVAVVGVLIGTAILSLHGQMEAMRAQLAQMQHAQTATQRQLARLEETGRQLASLRKETRDLRARHDTARRTVADLQARLDRLQHASGPTSPAEPSPEGAPMTGGRTPPRLVLQDGRGSVTLDRKGRLTGLPAVSPALAREIRTALTTERIPMPAVLRSLRRERGRLMGTGEGPAFALLGPVGTVIREDRPTFRWRPLPGATRYTVTITDAGGRVVAESPPLPGTQWRPMAALPRGRTYRWQVAALQGETEVVSPAPPAPEARFQVLDQAQAAMLARAEKAYRGSHLTLALLYARAGLAGAAARELEALVRRNPRSAAARNLLQSVRTWHPHPGSRRLHAPSPNSANPAQ